MFMKALSHMAGVEHGWDLAAAIAQFGGPRQDEGGDFEQGSEQGSEQPVQPVQPVQAEFQVTFNINSTLILTP